jgi:hypothetical protein
MIGCLLFAAGSLGTVILLHPDTGVDHRLDSCRRRHVVGLILERVSSRGKELGSVRRSCRRNVPWVDVAVKELCQDLPYLPFLDQVRRRAQPQLLQDLVTVEVERDP